MQPLPNALPNYSTKAISATMRYCTLCGIPITQRQLNDPWLREFRAGEFPLQLES